MEYRVFQPVLGQSSPQGSTHQAFLTGIVWKGTDVSQLAGYNNRLMTAIEIIEFNTPQISDQETLSAIKRLLMSLSSNILTNIDITQQEIDDLAVIYDYWNPDGKAYAVDEVFRYETNLYRIVQAHTSQPGWLPNITPALYTIKTPAGVIAPWIQPLGSSDAYAIGAKVTHNGFTWENNIAVNVWEPGVYGWTKF